MPKFVDDGPIWSPRSPLIERENRDEILSAPMPSVLLGLNDCSVSLFDLGVKSGMDFGRDWNNHAAIRSELQRHYDRMMTCLNGKRPHLFRAYAEGWVNGFNAIKSGVIQ